MAMTPEERHNLLLLLLGKYMTGSISQGELLTFLRKNILNMNKTEYSNLVKISRRTLLEIENDNGPFRESVLNKAFGPFGIKCGLVPAYSHIGQQLINSDVLELSVDGKA